MISDLRPWADPTVNGLNRLPMHVPLRGFRRHLLDGLWSLQIFDSPDAVPETALTDTGAEAAQVAVPGNWTMQDLGATAATAAANRPHYTNVQMPFPGPPPRLPEINPTGVYRRSVTLPADWMRGRCVLHVGGAESVHAVYVNGQFAGYGTDSRLPSEYETGHLLSPGRNEVAIVVVRYSAHSYLEDQDQWWMAGLHRSVWLESRPSVHIRDLPVVTDFDPLTGTGSVTATAMIDFGASRDPGLRTGTSALGNDKATIDFGASRDPGWSVRFTLRDPSGRVLPAQTESPVAETGPLCNDPDTRTDPARLVAGARSLPDEVTGFEVCTRWRVSDAHCWSAETPLLYSVTAELLDPRHETAHVETQRVGLQRVEVRDRRLLVNGQPIWVFGVNRHDHHPDHGKAVTVKDMVADLKTMRAHNIESVRTSHYPNDSAFYELCDRLGFYVIDEANIECHAHRDTLCDDPGYRAAFLERGARMVLRDRNHPSIIAWSLGNESGYGTSHDALGAWIRSADSSRPLHYEGAVASGGWESGGLGVSDLACPMYPEIAAIRSYGEDARGPRPLIMCEYSHAMGNSNGALADYWEAIESTDGLQGGFIWEFKDQALRQNQPGEHSRLAYGGQFGDTPNDGNFVADGLTSADLTPHPAMREVAWVYRPVTTRRSGSGLRIQNRRSFRSLSDLRAVWELLIDGVARAEGRLSVPEIAPLSSATTPLPETLTDSDHRSDRRLIVRWITVSDAWFAPAGHVMACDEIVLNDCRNQPQRSAADDQPTPQPAAEANAQRATATTTLADDQPTPQPAAEAAGGLVSPRLNLWRAPVDNDGFKLMPELASRLGVGGDALARWRRFGLDRLAPEEIVEHRAEIRSDDRSTVYEHSVDVPPDLADLPRIGVMLALPPRFEQLRWYGRGPHENYPDRNASAMTGIWQAQPDELPYLVPQEFGLRTDCRWLQVIDPERGEAVLVEAVHPATFHFSATHHTPADLTAAATQDELRRREELVLCVDALHRGLGTASCGPDVLAGNRIPAGLHEFSYRVSVISLNPDVFNGGLLTAQ